jgi:hypothetical protein
MKVVIFLFCLLPLVLCAPSEAEKRWIKDNGN